MFHICFYFWTGVLERNDIIVLGEIFRYLLFTQKKVSFPLRNPSYIFFSTLGPLCVEKAPFNV